MILVSVWGYTVFHDDDKPVNIFATLPIIMGFQAAIFQAMMLIPQVTQGMPSIVRVGMFMKQPEAPLPRDETLPWPAWAGPWPEVKSEDDTYAGGGHTLQIQGSFMWPGQKSPTLQDLNLSVPAGTSVAILGKVGSGKSTI